MALGALLDIVSSLLSGADIAGQSAEAARRSAERTSAPSWRSVGWAWLIIGATGFALWSRFPQFSEALPTLAHAIAVGWVIGLLVALLMAGAAVELWLVRRRAPAELDEPRVLRKPRPPRRSKRHG